MDEIWKPVIGYEGFYEVSNHGRVRSVPHEVHVWFGKRVSPSKILNQHKNGRTDYISVCLCKNNVKRTCLVHKLVAEAFIENPDNLPQINHKDEDKSNNFVDNLEWCDAKYNNNYGTKNQRTSAKNKISKCKPVAQIKDGVVIVVFPSTISAKHITDPGHIGACALGKRITAGGYVWKYI